MLDETAVTGYCIRLFSRDNHTIMNLEELRSEIDRVDREIIARLNERYQLVEQVGHWKRENNAPIYVPEREKALLDKLIDLNPGPMRTETLLAVYREIISGARLLERPLSVACLGPDGTYSSLAAKNKFGHGANYLTVNTIPDVFREVEAGRADYGCVPVENSTEGVVNPTLDTLRETSLRVIAELYLPIHHQLLSLSPLEEISCVYSHPQVLGQCRRYLAAHLSKASLIEVASSVRAAELAAREPGAAALASADAAAKYQLPVVAENVEDVPGNTTRFLVIAPQKTKPTGNDKTSVCFILKDRAGALYDALRPLSEAGISLSLIESRPLLLGRWEYCFFADVFGHESDENLQRAFAELEKSCLLFKIFGSYPRAAEN